MLRSPMHPKGKMPIFKPRRRFPITHPRYIFGALCFTFITYYWVLGQPAPSIRTLPKDAASNATLGFQEILVLSKGSSWRTRGLTAAAAYSGLDIHIPIQTLPTEELIGAFRTLGLPEMKRPNLGQAYNWLAHLDLVKYAIALDLETFLILEDDVDWDTSIKNQMQLISSVVREFTLVADTETSPYGRSWDILWLGHSGEHTANDTRRIEFEDPSAPLEANYTGWAKKYFSNIKPGTRVLHRGINPVGTIGYALTKRGAKKVAKWAGKGENEAYDIRLLQGCKTNNLNCLVVNPELMHHYIPPKEFGLVSEVAGVNGAGSNAEEDDFERLMGSTPNIIQSTRCQVLFGSTCLRK